MTRTIGVIGAGMLGGTLARKLFEAGYKVRVANSGPPETLSRIFKPYPRIVPVRSEEAASEADLVILCVPYRAIPELAATAFAADDGPPVIDAGNYRPRRDGPLPGIKPGGIDSIWVQHELGRTVYKAFNTIHPFPLERGGRTAGRSGRIALPVSGSPGAQKRELLWLVEQLGFSAVDAGELHDSWRQQPGRPAYLADFDAAGLRRALAQATLERRPVLEPRTHTELDELARRWSPSHRLYDAAHAALPAPAVSLKQLHA
ncbi:NADPH-dependent F420 reductase [Nocardia sp. NBC_01388]|uniref:NADPH-dependent F420 reductase n=1 Tax=Nocardia sp. NBC_01388 TaxID=2903596 RepID=UPI003254A19D